MVYQRIFFTTNASTTFTDQRGLHKKECQDQLSVPAPNMGKYGGLILSLVCRAALRGPGQFIQGFVKD